MVNVIARAGSGYSGMLGLTENQAAALGSTFLSMGKAPQLRHAIKGMSSAFAELKAGKHAKELQMLGLPQNHLLKAMNKDAQGAISDLIARAKNSQR